MKRSFHLAFLFLAAAILLSVGLNAADSPKITIAYSSNIMGYLEPCG